MKRTIAAVMVLLLVFAGPLLAQSPEGEADGESEQLESAEKPLPGWVLDLRRAEIVAAGSFPLTLLASRIVYSLARFTVRSIRARAIDMNYAPWFLAPPGAPELETGEKLGIVLGAVSLSGVVAFLDFRLGRAEEDAGEQ